MADADGIFVYSGFEKYRLMLPVAKHRKKNGKRASYIQEFNHQTNLNHEYKLIPLCKLYHGKKLISSGVTLILFNRTLDEKPEYQDCVCSNWNFNPIWGYSSEVVNVLYRNSNFQI